MKVRNISSKIINIGTTILLPENEMILGKEFIGTPVIKCLERMGMLRLIEEVVEKPAPVAAVEEETVVEEAPKKSRSKKKKAEETEPEAE